MLLHQLKKDDRVLHLEVKGKIETRDFEAVSREVDPFIETNGKLSGVLIKAPEFPGWDGVKALLSHLGFVKDHHRRVSRVAIVTDDPALEAGASAAGAVVDAEVKTFGCGDESIAGEWVANG